MSIRRILNIAVTAVCAALLLAGTVWLFVSWSRIPSQVPVNYAANGEITGYEGKGSLIFLQAVNWACFLFMTFMSFRPVEKGGAVRFMRFNTIRFGKIGRGNLTDRAFTKNPVAANNIVIDMLMGMRPVFVLILSRILIQSASGGAITAWEMPVAMAFLIIPVIIHIVRLWQIA